MPAVILTVLTKSFSPSPKGRRLQAITVSANRGQTNIRQANLENATIKTKGYLLRITESSIKNSTLTTPHIINIFDTEFTDSQVKTEREHIYAENIKVHGKVELEAHSTLNLILSQKDTDRINLDLSSQHGGIYHKPKEEHRGQKKRINLPTLIKLKKQISKIYSLQKPIRISTTQGRRILCST